MRVVNRVNLFVLSCTLNMFTNFLLLCKSVNNVNEIYIFTVKKVKIFRFKDYNGGRNIKGVNELETRTY